MVRAILELGKVPMILSFGDYICYLPQALCSRLMTIIVWGYKAGME